MNQEALEYAREQLNQLFDEGKSDNAARIEAIRRVREQFSLGLKEAKDLVDQAYEEWLEEIEEEELDEEEGAIDDHPKIVGEFLDHLEKVHGASWVDDAGFIMQTLCGFLRDYHGTSLDKIDRALVDEYLLEYFPRKVTADAELTRRVPQILNLFFHFAEPKAYVESPAQLIRTVEKLQDSFIKVAQDSSNFGLAKSFATAMQEAGVDPSDKDQVDTFMLAYNLKNFGKQWLGGLPPMPKKIEAPAAELKPPMSRNGPCPCGSGRKYKRCCGKAGAKAPGPQGARDHRAETPSRAGGGKTSALKKATAIKADTPWQIGDSVVVKPGTIDPDLGSDLGGWQGRISDMEDGEDGESVVTIHWDSITLKNMPASLIAECERQGLGWEQMRLPMHEVEPATPRDTESDVARTVKELSAQYEWYSLGEEGERIQKVLAGVDPEDDWEALQAWEEYLRKTLTVPFPAVVSEYQDHGPLQSGDRVMVTGFSGIDDLYGVMVRVQHGRQAHDFPLCDLEATDKKSAHYQPVSDYSVWFANR